jgi:hypothetical protein
LPLSLRKANLARLLMRCAAGIFIAEYEQRKIGDVLFRVACDMGGLEGLSRTASTAALTPVNAGIGYR